MTDTAVITALIADDDHIARAQLVLALETAWPTLHGIEVVNGNDAWDAVLEFAPALCFLDVRMPGLTGIDVAQRIDALAHVVFVCTPTDPALQSLEDAGVDYLRKPVDVAGVSALRDRLLPLLGQPPADIHALLDRLAGRLRRPALLESVRTGLGRDTEFVQVEDIVCFETDGRHTRVVSRAGQGLIRTPIKDLVGQLDSVAFVQIGRHALVNRGFITQFDQTSSGDLELSLQGRSEPLAVDGRFRSRVLAVASR